MALLDHLLHSCSPHTGTSLRATARKPGDGWWLLGPAEYLWTGTEDKGCGVTVEPTSEELDCRNTVRSKFLFVELQWSPPSPLGKAEDTAPTQGWTDRSHMDTQVEQTHKPAQLHRHRDTQATAPKNTHSQQTKPQD